MVRIWYLSQLGLGSVPGWGSKILQAAGHGLKKKEKLQRQYNYVTESLKKKGKEKKKLPLPHSVTQPGLRFGLLPSRSLSNNCDSSGSGGEGSQWADTQVNGGLPE